MTEVNLVKRFYIVLIIFALGGVSACTRDKPADPTPTLPPRTVIVASSSSSAAPVALPTVVVPASPVIATVEITTTPVIIISPSATPPPTPTQAPLPGTSSAPGTYTVKWGDWLNKIAADNGVTVQAILAANPGVESQPDLSRSSNQFACTRRFILIGILVFFLIIITTTGQSIDLHCSARRMDLCDCADDSA